MRLSGVNERKANQYFPHTLTGCLLRFLPHPVLLDRSVSLYDVTAKMKGIHEKRRVTVYHLLAERFGQRRLFALKVEKKKLSD